MIPGCVCQVFPDYFPAKNTKLSGKKHPCHHFSHLGVRDSIPDIMATSVSHTTDPETLVTFVADGGSIQTQFAKPLQIVSPPMITCFPKLGGIVPSNEPDATYAQGSDPHPPKIDITLKGAELPQNQFKEWMDKLDDVLLHFVYQNQNILARGAYPLMLSAHSRSAHSGCMSLCTQASHTLMLCPAASRGRTSPSRS